MESDPPPFQPDERNILAEERTKLAAERTFLAWLRTGMTSIGIGIAVARFITFRQIVHQQIGHLTGQILILWGICIFVFALTSYRRSIRQFAPSITPPFAGLVIATIILIILCLALFWIIVE